MPPELQRPRPVDGALPFDASASPPQGPANDGAAVEDIRRGAARVASQPGARRAPARRRPSFVLSACVGLVVGAATALFNRLEYNCVATFLVNGVSDAASLAAHAQTLAAFVERGPSSETNPVAAPNRCQVATMDPDRIYLRLTTARSEAGVERVRALSEAFLAAFEARRAQARVTPGETEQVLAEWANRFRERVSITEEELRTGQAGLADRDPRGQRDLLLAKWKSKRTAFDDLKRRWTESAAARDRLEKEAEPTHSVVAADRRREVIQADAALQQDLRELHLKLSEVKLHLLNVWQNSAAPLDQLRRATGRLSDTLKESGNAGTEVSVPVESLTREAAKYEESLTTFAEAWNREFAGLRSHEVDPLAGDVLEGFARSRKLVNEWLFVAAGHLTELRRHEAAVSGASSAQARYFVFQSNLARAFQVLQGAHHRFEFAAGTIEPRQSFRLDSALESAGGLRRRTQQRIRAVDERLQAEALVEAKELRVRQLAETRGEGERLRAEWTQIASDMAELQSELNQHAGWAEQFVVEKSHLEAARNRRERTAEDLQTTENQLRELAQRRTAANDSARWELISCEVAGSPTNLARYLQTVGVATLLAALSVHLGQWRMLRRV